MFSKNEIIQKLEQYFHHKPHISFVFLFGSVADENTHRDSDIDLGIYFEPQGKEIEWEVDIHYVDEDTIWLELEKLLGNTIDLLVLNRIPAFTADNIIRNGIPIIIKDNKIFLEYMLRVTMEATDYREQILEFWRKKVA